MSNRAESAKLRERIYAAFPVAEPAFLKLLGLLDIEATDQVRTAAVTTGLRSRLQINPAFIADYCPSDTDLTMLVLHELYHVVLGHTRLFPRATLAQNWAFDAVINAQLCQLFPLAHQTALFRRLYPADVFPLAMLRPPEGWRTPQEHWVLDGPAGRVHRALYQETSVSYTQLYDLLPEAAIDCGTLSLADLLGAHDNDDALPADLAAEVRTLIARWPMAEQRSGRDPGGPTEWNAVRLARARGDAVRVIRTAILVLAEGGRNGTSASVHSDWAPLPSVLPYRTGPDRRADLRTAAGETALFHRSSLEQPDRSQGQRVHVYVDTSGSMSDALPGVYSALIPLLDWIDPAIHLFSTELIDVTHADLRRGITASTCGTSIEPVTAHVLAHGVRRALILTDGWVGEIPSQHAIELKAKRVRLGAVVTADGDTSFVDAVGGKSWQLPSLDTR